MAFDYEGTSWCIKQAVMNLWKRWLPGELYIAVSLEICTREDKMELRRFMLFWKCCQMHSFQKSCSPKLLPPNTLIILILRINEVQTLGYVQPSWLGNVIRFHKKPRLRETVTKWSGNMDHVCFFCWGFKEPERSMVHISGLNIPHYDSPTSFSLKWCWIRQPYVLWSKKYMNFVSARKGKYPISSHIHVSAEKDPKCPSHHRSEQ